MTILVAIKKNGRVFLGADRMINFGSEYHTDLVGGQKIIKLKHAYLATSGYTLLDNIVEHLVATDHKMMENPFRNRADVFTFFLGLYGELKKAYTLVDTGKDTYAGLYNVFFLITPTNIYGVQKDISVNEFPHYATKGAGCEYALGCLYGLYDSIDDGYELVRLSLEAACHFSIYCREPLDIIEIKAEDFEGPHNGYKVLGKGLRTLPKRKTPGNLLAVMTRSSGKVSRPAIGTRKTKTKAKDSTVPPAKSVPKTKARTVASRRTSASKGAMVTSPAAYKNQGNNRKNDKGKAK